MALDAVVAYRSLIVPYLRDCVLQRRRVQIGWHAEPQARLAARSPEIEMHDDLVAAAADDNARVVIFPPLLLVICIGVGLIAWRLLPLQPITLTFAIPMAVLCVVSGLLLDRLAQQMLRRASTAIHPSQSTQAIVETGPFGRSRNPIYVGQALLLLAVGFIVHEVSYFIACIPWYFTMRYGVIAREERYLSRKFGNAYVDYMGRVGRWI